MLRLPDLSCSFVVDTDACVNATGAVLLQEYSDGLHPVAFHSAKYNPAECNYRAADKELLAIIQACTKWRCYLEGLPSKITLTMSLTKHCILSFFFHDIRLAGWSG